MTATLPGVNVQPSVDNPGWLTWNMVDTSRFNGQVMGNLLVRIEAQAGGKRNVRLRMQPEHRHSNLLNAVHGGVTMALIDIALFAAIRLLLDGDPAGSVTLDLTTQFIGSGKIGQPLDAVAEVLRETRRLVFLRGLIEQDDALVASFNGTVRKPSRR